MLSILLDKDKSNNFQVRAMVLALKLFLCGGHLFHFFINEKQNVFIVSVFIPLPYMLQVPFSFFGHHRLPS